MRSFVIACGLIESPSSTSPSGGGTSEETVLVEWGPEDKRQDPTTFSPIDDKPFQGTPCIKVQAGRDFQGANGLSLR